MMTTWWWNDHITGIACHTRKGVQSAFKFVHSQIVTRYVQHQSFKESDQSGDEFYRIHARAFDNVIRQLNPECRDEPLCEECKAIIAQKYRDVDK